MFIYIFILRINFIYKIYQLFDFNLF